MVKIIFEICEDRKCEIEINGSQDIVSITTQQPMTSISCGGWIRTDKLSVKQLRQTLRNMFGVCMEVAKKHTDHKITDIPLAEEPSEATK